LDLVSDGAAGQRDHATRVAAIESAAAKWDVTDLDPNKPSDALAGDVVTLLAEVKRLRAEVAALAEERWLVRRAVSADENASTSAVLDQIAREQAAADAALRERSSRASEDVSFVGTCLTALEPAIGDPLKFRPAASPGDRVASAAEAAGEALREYERLHELQRPRVRRAEEAWRRAHGLSGKPVHPDLGKLVSWLSREGGDATDFQKLVALRGLEARLTLMRIRRRQASEAIDRQAAVGRKLNDRRLELGLSIGDLAEPGRMSEGQVLMVLHGDVDAHIKHVLAVSRRLGLTFDFEIRSI